MKFTAFLVALSVVYGVEATTNASTVTCSSCPPSSSTNDIVTRSDVPVVSCSSPPLMVVVNGTTSVPSTMPSATGEPSSTMPTTPSPVPTAGGNKIIGSAGAAVALAVAVIGLM